MAPLPPAKPIAGRNTAGVPRAAGKTPPTTGAPRYQTFKRNVNLAPNQSLRFAAGKGYYAGSRVAPGVRKSPAGTRTAPGPGAAPPTTPESVAKSLTDSQYAGPEFQIQQAIQRSVANRNAALASLADWSKQIQSNFKKYSGLTNQAFSGAVAGQQSSDANIASLFGESNAPQASALLAGNETELRALGADQSAFSSEMGPILQQAQMDLAGQSEHAFAQEQQSLNDQAIQLQSQKANDYVKNYQDIIAQAADKAYKDATLAERTAHDLETTRIARQRANNAAIAANNKTEAAKNKFTYRVGNDGSITYVYADGRIVKAAPPGTVPQRKSSAATGSWSTKVLKDGSVIQTNSKTGAIVQVKPPGTVKAPPTSPSAASTDKLNQSAYKDAEKWYNGVQPATDASGNYKHVDSKGNPTDGISGVSYQETLRKLQTKYPRLTLAQRQDIANSFYKPGEDGRPFLSSQERAALIKAGVKPATVQAAMFDKHNSEVLRHNYPGVIAKANANPSRAGAGQSPAAFDTASKVIATAKQFIGTPYKFGGASPQTGFDCSGLLTYAFGKQGIKLPHNAAQQFHQGTPVDPADLRAGDAVFFVTDGTPEDPGHVGIYLGNGQVLTSPHTGAVVHIDELAQHSGYAGARRYI